MLRKLLAGKFHQEGDPELRRSINDQYREVQDDLAYLSKDAGALDRFHDHSYPGAFSELRAERFRAIAENLIKDFDRKEPAERGKMLLELTKAELAGIRGGIADPVTQQRLNPATPELLSLDSATLLVKDANRGDATRAMEQIETIDLSRRLVSGSLIVLYIALAGFQLFQIVTAIIAKWAQVNHIEMAIREISGGLSNLFTLPAISSSFFGLIGASLAIWLDRQSDSDAAHWQIVRRRSRAARCWLGLLVGFVVYVLMPVLIGPTASPTPAATGSPQQDPAVSRLFLFAIVAGFSQDLFIKRLQALTNLKEGS
jgi:hypothetical protein